MNCMVEEKHGGAQTSLQFGEQFNASKAAGAPSMKPGNCRRSPAARPSQLFVVQPPRVVTAATCQAAASRGVFDALDQSGKHSPRLGSLLGRSSFPRSRSAEHAHDKQEGHYAIRFFGVQPDIDFTFKRSTGDFSPRLAGTRQEQVPFLSGHGTRSAFSDHREALKAFGTFGVGPSVEVIDRRGVGSCSPRLEDKAMLSRGSPHRRNSYLHDCRTFGLSDINEIRRLGTGDCSPRWDPDACVAATVATRDISSRTSPTNFISTEARLAREPFRKSKSMQTLEQAEAPDSPLSPKSPKTQRELWQAQPHSSLSARSPMSGRSHSPPHHEMHAGGLAGGQPDDKECSLYAPTASSRARYARDLSSLKADDKTRSGGLPTSAKTHATRSRRPSTVSEPSTSDSSISKCTHSCRLATGVSQKSQSAWTTSTGTSSLKAISHRSFKLAGTILSELKEGRTIESRASCKPMLSATSALLSQTSCPVRPECSITVGPRLAGNILADLKSQAAH